MKFVIDERLKHRLIGLAVVVSIAAIFFPAIVKKPHHGFNNNRSLQMPAKPVLPNVEVSEERMLFKSVTVAHVDIPSVDEPLTTIKAKAKSISLHSPSIQDPVKTLPSHPLVVSKDSRFVKDKIVPIAVKQHSVTKTLVASTKTTAKKIVVPNYYMVQIAVFLKQTNAEGLVSKLKVKGYNAYFNKSNGKKGPLFTVFVGKENKKQQAQLLQQQVASLIQIKGLIVTSSGVS